MQKINVTQRVNEIEKLLEEGNVRDAATLAIASLSSSENNVCS